MTKIAVGMLLPGNCTVKTLISPPSRKPCGAIMKYTYTQPDVPMMY